MVCDPRPHCRHGRRRHEVHDVHADHLFGLVPEHVGEGAVGLQQVPPLVDHDPLASRVRKGSEALFAGAQVLDGLPVLRDVLA
jgi:hypothetical protein